MAVKEPHVGESHIPDIAHHVHLPTTRPSLFLDRILDWVGTTFSWLWMAVMVVILISVIARYVFGQGSIMMEEITWHLYGAAWLVGLSYALVHDDHVRVDVLHELFSSKTKARVELFGILFLLLPFLIIFFWDSIPYFWQALQLNERSQAPDGLAARWALKFFLPFSLFLLIIAAIARLLKCTAQLFGRPAPVLNDPFVKGVSSSPPSDQ